MTAFITRCCKRHSLLSVLAALALLLLAAPAAHAEGIDVRHASLVAGEEGYYLEADFEIALNSTLEDALHKGVPLYFLLEIEVIRTRWYWLNEKVFSTQQP